jgi:hypothetical protein
MWKFDPSCIAVRNGKWCTRCVNSLVFLKNLIRKFSYHPAMLFLGGEIPETDKHIETESR